MITKKIPTALASKAGFFRQFLLRRARRWLCQKIFRDEFFNRDASLEIDKLVLENERLRAEGKKCRPPI